MWGAERTDGKSTASCKSSELVFLGLASFDLRELPNPVLSKAFGLALNRVNRISGTEGLMIQARSHAEKHAICGYAICEHA